MKIGLIKKIVLMNLKKNCKYENFKSVSYTTFLYANCSNLLFNIDLCALKVSLHCNHRQFFLSLKRTFFKSQKASRNQREGTWHTGMELHNTQRK